MGVKQPPIYGVTIDFTDRISLLYFCKQPK